MTTVASSVSSTLVSMLGAINVTANTASRTVHTAASGIDMLDQYVQDARTEQLARSIANRHTLLHRIREDAAKDNAKRQAELERELQSDQALAKYFEANLKAFDTEVAPLIAQRLAAQDHRVAIA